MKTSIYLTKSDIEIILEWKEALKFDNNVDVIRFALRRLGGAIKVAIPRSAVHPGENGNDIITIE